MLCDICESLNLSADNFVIKSDDDTATFKQYHDLGSLQAIRKKSSQCALCRLVVEAVGVSQTLPGPQEKDILCQLYWQDDGFLWTVEAPTVRNLRISSRPWPPSFNEFNRLTILADDAPNGQQLFFGRRIVETSIDIKLVKKWMKLCQRWHGEDCQQLSTSNWEFPSNFRVVDAWTRCVVDAPSTCKYLALSYVWGRVEVFKLTTNNLDELQTAGGLKNVWQNLPNTIRDAIALTSSLSIRYIWIDSLCILQDDDKDKSSLIPYMHLIYDRAFMTIVAGNGKDAEGGLSGFGTNSRAREQMVEEIRPGLRIICPKHVVDTLDQSIYESRAWTYQEKGLSRRCLVFSDGQIMFQCRSMLWREDVYLEHVDLENSFDMSLKHSINGKSAAGEPHSDYAGSLYEYSGRFLSYNSDVLNAFAGVLGILTQRVSKEPTQELSEVYGLPTCFFDWAILWEPNKTARRRSGGWPSWSWCGWTGQMRMFLSGFDASKLEDWLCHHTWIKWIIYDLNGRPLTHLPSNSTYEREGSCFPPIDYPQTLPAPAAKVQSMIASSMLRYGALESVSKPPLVSDRNGCSPLLHLTTLSTHFRLAPTDVLTGDVENSDRSYKIGDASGAPCGTIWINTAWHYSPDKAYEFIVLSDAKRTAVVTKNEFPPIKSEFEWDAYHVTMISWQGNGDVAERVAIGVVYREAINKAVEPGTEWKEIWLR